MPIDVKAQIDLLQKGGKGSYDSFDTALKTSITNINARIPAASSIGAILRSNLAVATSFINSRLVYLVHMGCNPLTPENKEAFSHFLQCLNIIDAQLDILTSIDLNASSPRPNKGLISIEFEFSNASVQQLTVGENKTNDNNAAVNTFKSILSALGAEANKQNYKVTEVKNGGKGKLTDLIQVDVQLNNKIYKIEYDWDESCIECRLVKIPIAIWYDGALQKDLRDAINEKIYGVCQATGLIKSIYPKGSTLQANWKDNAYPLQCHINICNTVFGHCSQVLNAYGSVMGATTATDTSVNDSVKINSGTFKDRQMVKLSNKTFNLPRPLSNPLINPNVKIINTTADPTLSECYNTLKKALSTSIFMGQGSQDKTYNPSSTNKDIAQWLIKFGNQTRMAASFAGKSEAQKAQQTPIHYLALNVEHCVVANNTDTPYIECRRPEMPTNASGLMTIINEVLAQIYIPTPDLSSCSLVDTLNQVTQLAKDSGITLPVGWDNFS